MRTFKILGLAAALPVLAGLSVANADTMRGDALKTHIADSTIRGDFRSLRGYENHVWSFKSDGTVNAEYTRLEGTGQGSGAGKSLTDTGTWWIQSGETLCVDFKAIFRGAPTCFNVEAKADRKIELMGVVEMTGTIKKTM